MSTSKSAILVLSLLVNTVCAQESSDERQSIRRALPQIGRVTPISSCSERSTIGPSFRAEFADGFAFFAARKRDASKSFHWQTVRVRVGSRGLETESPTTRQEAWRYEFHDHGVIEVYDVGCGGVEQSFVLHSEPAAKGDLVIRGRVTTPLTAEPQRRHGPLVFRDAKGEAVVEYGVAFVFDASGRRLDLETAWDGTHIELRVPASWLANASYPVTVDPLTSAKKIVGLTDGWVRECAVGVEAISKTHNTLVMYSVWPMPFNNEPFATHVLLCNSDFTGAVEIYRSNNAASLMRDRIAPVGGAKKWVISVPPTNPNDPPSFYVHSFGNTTFNSGQLVVAPLPSGALPWSYARVGGSRFGNTALALVPIRIGTIERIHAHRIRLNPVVVDPGFDLGLAPTYEYPPIAHVAINQVSEGTHASPSWIVCHFRKSPIALWPSTWEAVRVRDNGFTTPPRIIAQAFPGAPQSIEDYCYVRVAGSGGRYVMLSFTGFNSLSARRFDWAENSTSPVLGTTKVLHAGWISPVTLGDVSYNRNTLQPQWALTFLTSGNWGLNRVMRVDHKLTVLENLGVTTAAFSPASIAWDGKSNCFAIGWGVGAPASLTVGAVWARKLCN